MVRFVESWLTKVTLFSAATKEASVHAARRRVLRKCILTLVDLGRAEGARS